MLTCCGFGRSYVSAAFHLTELYASPLLPGFGPFILPLRSIFIKFETPAFPPCIADTPHAVARPSTAASAETSDTTAAAIDHHRLILGAATVRARPDSLA